MLWTEICHVCMITHTRVWCSSPHRTVDVCMFAFPTLGDDGHTLASECLSEFPSCFTACGKQLWINNKITLSSVSNHSLADNRVVISNFPPMWSVCNADKWWSACILIRLEWGLVIKAWLSGKTWAGNSNKCSSPSSYDNKRWCLRARHLNPEVLQMLSNQQYCCCSQYAVGILHL